MHVQFNGVQGRRWLDAAVTLLPFIGLGLVVALVGWPHGAREEAVLIAATRMVAVLYGALFLVDWVHGRRWVDASLVKRLALPALAAVILLSALLENYLSEWIHEGFAAVPVRFTLLGLATAQQVAALAMRVGAWIPRIEASALRRVNPGTILFGSFAALIVLGTLLLKLPNATVLPISWIDAVFTSTSAVCVTGLIVVDTATAFTPLGQGIILLLIQLGAFGIVTLTFFLAVVTGQGFSVAGRVLLRDILNIENLRSLGTAVAFLILFTLAAEAAGWAALYHFWKSAGEPVENLWWVSLFHSVSAFCNAGFSVFTAGLADPRADSNYPVQAVIMLLIVLGGIGFTVLGESIGRIKDVLLRRRGVARASVHLRLTVATTAVLLAGGALLLFLGDHGTASADWPRRLWIALFNSTTARTAGFNITDMAALSSAATAVMIFLMFIGGSPGGFAGGIKTTTFALAMLNLRRILLARREVELLGRRIDENVSNRAFAVMLVSFMWIFAATTLILFLQPQFSLPDTLFEVVSAFSTVGLSRGITAALEEPAKAVITATMFVGRIGVLNFFFSLLVVPPGESRVRMPRERIIIE